MDRRFEKSVVLRLLHRASIHQTDLAGPRTGPSLSYAISIAISSLPGAIFVVVDGIVHALKDYNFDLFDFVPYGSLWAAKPIPVLQHSLFSSKVTAIATGSEHALFLLEDGTVLSAGSNRLGQCGTVTDTPTLPTPMKINLPSEYDEKITNISAGEAHSLLLTESGLVFGFGSNESGQIGLGASVQTASAPTLIKSLSDAQIVSMACGMRHSAFVDESGYLFTCGSNTYLQCDPEAQQTIPRIVPDLVECLTMEGHDIDDVFASQFSTILVVNQRSALRVLGLFAWPGEAPWLEPTAPVWADSTLLEFGGSILSVSCGVREVYVMVNENDGKRKVWRFGDVWPPQELRTEGLQSVWACRDGPIACIAQAGEDMHS